MLMQAKQNETSIWFSNNRQIHFHFLVPADAIVRSQRKHIQIHLRSYVSKELYLWENNIKYFNGLIKFYFHLRYVGIEIVLQRIWKQENVPNSSKYLIFSILPYIVDLFHKKYFQEKFYQESHLHACYAKKLGLRLLTW